MKTVTNSTMPAEGMFLLQFWNEDWIEFMDKATWTNDPMRIAREFDKLRECQWAILHGMTPMNPTCQDVFAITVEVCRG